MQGGVSCKMKALKESGGGAPTWKENGNLSVEISVLLSTNPATADTLRQFKYVESCRMQNGLYLAQRKRVISWLISMITRA